jgi:large subunit ribosomal protein L21
MEPYVVVETGGKQYLVQQNKILNVELLDFEPGANVTLDRVLAVSDGTTLTVGTPYVEGATVSAVVMEHFRAPKVVSFKFKKRKRYRRKQGHRQEQTRLKILSLPGGAAPAAEPAAEQEPAVADA